MQKSWNLLWIFLGGGQDIWNRRNMNVICALLVSAYSLGYSVPTLYKIVWLQASRPCFLLTVTLAIPSGYQNSLHSCEATMKPTCIFVPGLFILQLFHCSQSAIKPYCESINCRSVIAILYETVLWSVFSMLLTQQSNIYPYQDGPRADCIS